MYTFDVCLIDFKEKKKKENWIFNSSCAFQNTPKFTQVKQTRKGFIVNKQWILDCYKQNQLLSEKNYQFKGSNNDNNERKNEIPNRTSERKQTKIINFDDNDEEEEEEPIISKDVTKKTPLKKKMTTFDDDDEEEEEPAVSTAVKRKITIVDDDDGNVDFYVLKSRTD